MKYRLSQIRNKDGLYSIRSDTGHRVVMVWGRELGERIVTYLMNSEQAAPDVAAENPPQGDTEACEQLRAALKELVKAADPRTNMSDIPLLDALSVARAAIARAEGGGE